MNKNFPLYVIIGILVIILVATNITGVEVSTVRGDLSNVQAELTARAEASAEAPAEVEPEATEAPMAEEEPEVASDPAPIETQDFTLYESEGGIPYSGTEWVVDVAPGEIEVFTGGPMTIGGVSLKGGETRGSVLILLPGAKVTRYTVTNVLPGSNWHGSYQSTKVDESVWRALANDRVTAMINSQDNCSLGVGCTTVDVLVIDSSGVVDQWTISK